MLRIIKFVKQINLYDYTDNYKPIVVGGLGIMLQ